MVPSIVHRRAILAAGLAGAGVSTPALAYPDRPLRLVIPNPPGGANDLFGRLIAAFFQARTGQNMVVENRSGASSIIGVNAVARSEPDGYTLGLISSTFTGSVSVAPQVPFDPIADLAYLGLIGSGPMILAVRRDFPAATPEEFVRRVREEPRRFTYTSSGIGSIGHMATALFEQRLGLTMLHVPFRGLGPAMTEMVAGRIDVLIGSPASSMGHIREGRIRPLATTGASRAAVLPEIPTLREAGFDYGMDLWWGLIGPARMPPAAQQRINALLADGVGNPELAAAIRHEGAEPASMDLDGFNAFVRQDIRRWRDLAASTNIRSE